MLFPEKGGGIIQSVVPPATGMLLQIVDVIDRNLIAAVREASRAPGFWSDGRETAQGRARDAKRNDQALARGPAKGVLATLGRAVLDNATVASAAQPAALARILLNRYAAGMEYGAHVDAPYIDGVRTDLSFTLFLSDPDEYEGGELIVDSAGAEDAVKLAAGALALYPSTSVHRVARIERGERLCAVGWIKSRVRSAERRAVLFELDRINAELAAVGAPGEVRDRLAIVRNNLLRRWGE
jgi:PKHD-type hydroxylase